MLRAADADADFHRSIVRGSVDSENVLAVVPRIIEIRLFRPCRRQLRPCKTSDLSCVRWLVLMHHTDGNAANIGGRKKKGKKKGKKRKKKGRSFYSNFQE